MQTLSEVHTKEPPDCLDQCLIATPVQTGEDGPVSAQLFPVKWFGHEKSVLLLEKIWHRFGGSQKSYMFLSTFSTRTDCYLTHDHILFEYKKATGPLPSLPPH